MNRYTKTPVNTVWFCCILAILLGLLVFAGEAAIESVFTLGIVGLYIAYAIPIAARFIFKNDHKPGPFDLGIWVSGTLTHQLACIPDPRQPLFMQSFPVAVTSVTFMTFMGIVFLFPTTPEVGVGDMNYTVVVLGGVLILSVAYYYFPKYGGKNWFTGPIPTIGVRERSIDDDGDEEKQGGMIEVVRTKE